MSDTIVAAVPFVGTGGFLAPSLAGELKFSDGVNPATWNIPYLRQQKARLDAIVGRARSLELATRTVDSTADAITVGGLDDDILKYSTEDPARLGPDSLALLGL